jgi:hypothetical protein
MKKHCVRPHETKNEFIVYLEEFERLVKRGEIDNGEYIRLRELYDTFTFVKRRVGTDLSSYDIRWNETLRSAGTISFRGEAGK